MKKFKTLHEKWESDAREKDHGLGFHDTEETGFIEMEGFTDEELKNILGDKYEMYKKQHESSVDEIEEI